MFIIPIYLFSEIFPGVSRGPICSSCTRAHSPVWPPLCDILFQFNRHSCVSYRECAASVRAWLRAVAVLGRLVVVQLGAGGGRGRSLRGRFVGVVVSAAAGLPRPAGGVRRLSRPLAGHAQPHRRAPGLVRRGRRRRDALPPAGRLLPGGPRRRLAEARSLLRRPAPATAAVSRPRVT